MLPEKENLFWQKIQIDLNLAKTYETKMNFAVTRVFDGRAIASCGHGWGRCEKLDSWTVYTKNWFLQ